MSNSVKVHRRIDDDTADAIRKVASELGLEVINYNKTHRLYKVGSKFDEVTVQITERRCVGAGEVRLIGDGQHVGLHIASLREWFRTSKILSCKKQENCVNIETANSFYELVEDE